MIRRGLAAVATAALLVVLALPLTAQPASACDVSYGYKPSLNLNKPNFGRGAACSTGTSLAGAFFVALLAVGAVVAGGALAYRKAETLLRTSTPPPSGPGHPAPGHPGPAAPPTGQAWPGPTGPWPPPPHQAPHQAAPNTALIRYLDAAGIVPPAAPGRGPMETGGGHGRPGS
ncbi:hypothetical protein [Actinoallomurus iriomotensis]|uniref:Uncharacterized protein n=1 Tax=Actinoallomurus iriomotensis TaxID=478107 RepID=A0A9W6RPA2_9ACTN|nr:hypothetical protein [Actinoallomurus iriomotensis]GLY79303.1 hypothetical protein Airi01_075700 [Actinoallomurus iriomotensis]